jgi:hypothetical protein
VFWDFSQRTQEGKQRGLTWKKWHFARQQFRFGEDEEMNQQNDGG